MNKHNVMNGILAFMSNEMIPKASGNNKILLRGAKALVSARFDNIFDSIKGNALVAMTGVIQGDEVDVDAAAKILQDALDSDEFIFSFTLLGVSYDFAFNAEDIRLLKNYIERT